MRLFPAVLAFAAWAAGVFSPGSGAPAAVGATTAAELPAPALLSPAEGEILASFGPTLSWRSPEGATQVHLQVIPFNNDGPGLDILLGTAATSFRIAPPPAWYGLLPDMTYTWRARVAGARVALTADDPSWGPWGTRTFRTPAVTSATLSLVEPARGAIVTTRTPRLQWRNARQDVFYYELQLSKDPEFGRGLFGAWAPVHWQLVHGGLAQPLNTYQVPTAAPLDDNALYYWRVRPRVQGDGTPVAWSLSAEFQTVTAAGRPRPTPSPRPTATPGWILFVSDRDGNPEIYVMNSDGGGQTRLTHNPAADILPAWSPDGRKIAFASDREGKYELYLMSADGSGQTRLTDQGLGVSRPIWSPDGAKMAFWAFDEDFPNTEIFVMNRDGGGLTRLTRHPASDIMPTWSPDGARIAFASRRDGNAEIYVMNADGSDQRPLTRDSATDTQPAWSPDGSKLAFVSDRDENQELYLMNPDGEKQTRLTTSPYRDEQPVWSPLARKIAYQCLLKVCLVDINEARAISLTAAPAMNPSWSPDGRKIAYECGSNLCVVNADGSDRAQLTLHQFTDWDPIWSPR